MRTLVAFLVALSSVAGQARAAGDAPVAGDARAAYLGSWQGTGTFYTTKYSKAGTSSGQNSCAWQVETTYLVCSQTFTGPDGPGRALSIYTRNGAAYGFLGVDPDGTTRALTLTVTDAGEIIYPSSFTEKDGTKVMMRTVNTFPSRDEEDWRVEYSTDGGKTWTKMADGVVHRVSGNANR